MPKSVAIKLSRLRFPSRCCGCGGARETDYEIKARRGWDLLVGAYYEQIRIPVPVCNRCRGFRRWLRPLEVVVFVLPLIGLVAGLGLATEIVGESARDVWRTVSPVVVLGLLVWLWWAKRGLRLIADRWALGVCSTRWIEDKDGLKVLLSFKRDALAHEVAGTSPWDHLPYR